MKRLGCYMLLLLSMTATVIAKPAKRNFHILTQPDGTELTVMAAGDEFKSYFVNDRGERLRINKAGYWVPLTSEELEAQNNMIAEKRAMRQQLMTRSTTAIPTKGEHHLLTLFVQFSNKKFTLGTPEVFEQMLNGTDYTFQGATGSAQRYYRDQSNEQYHPIFDIVGPVTLDNSYQYYGGNTSSGDDLRPTVMISEAIQKAIDQKLITDPSIYDGDGDGFVDLVYVFYAGYSEAENLADNADCIWPHAWALASQLTYQGVSFSRYACSSELKGAPTDQGDVEIDGIGSCVHEFGHCLGLPDFYNTGSEIGTYGMDTWSVMDQGCYNNDGKTPASFTAYERAFCGWMELTPLPESGEITLYPIDTAFHAYVYYNPSNKDEYFIFENHQNQGWDTYFGYYGADKNVHGMLITHVDYSAVAWNANKVNIDPQHQRYTVVPADGELLPYDNVGVTLSYAEWGNSFIRDIWPGLAGAKKFSKETSPAAKFFTGDEASFEIDDIAETNGIITFKVKPFGTSAIDRIESDATAPGANAELYDMTGKRILSGTPEKIDDATLSRGIYIIRDADGKTRKITR